MDKRRTLLFLEKNVDMVAPALDGLTLEVYLRGWTDTISLEPTRIRFFSGDFLDVDFEVTDVMKVAAAEGLDRTAVAAYVKAEHLKPTLQLVLRTLGQVEYSRSG